MIEYLMKKGYISQSTQLFNLRFRSDNQVEIFEFQVTNSPSSSCKAMACFIPLNFFTTCQDIFTWIFKVLLSWLVPLNPFSCYYLGYLGWPAALALWGLVFLFSWLIWHKVRRVSFSLSWIKSQEIRANEAVAKNISCPSCHDSSGMSRQDLAQLVQLAKEIGLTSPQKRKKSSKLNQNGPLRRSKRTQLLELA